MITSFDNKLTFGKYKGKTFLWVLLEDLQYAQWLIDKTNRVKLSEEQEDTILSIESNYNQYREEVYFDLY